jgi:hypothetical protein
LVLLRVDARPHFPESAFQQGPFWHASGGTNSPSSKATWARVPKRPRWRPGSWTP